MASETSTWSPGNNSATVKALLLSRLQSGQQPDRVVHPYYQPWSNLSDLPQMAPSGGSTSSSSKTTIASPPPACPMHVNGDSMAESSGPSTASKLNPLNMLPTLSQERAANQKSILPTERTRSTIPRSFDAPAPGASPYDKATDGSGCPVPHDQRSSMFGDKTPDEAAEKAKEDPNSTWEYPSPQQFYNALVRKGWETPEEHVEMMVMVHNFLNERAWQEVLDWEKDMGIEAKDLALARFQGKPGTLSPKARLFSWAGMIAPSKFNSEPPFDRHDWVVRRPAASPNAKGREVRYVIDYYSAPDDPDTDEPVFHLDVRPALDSVEATMARLKRGWKEWSNPPKDD